MMTTTDDAAYAAAAALVAVGYDILRVPPRCSHRTGSEKTEVV